MTFTRPYSLLIFSYYLQDFVISRCGEFVIGLDFKFSSSLDLSLCIDMICGKALKALGYIMRLAKDFRLKSVFKVFYRIIVRPILKYDTLIWNPGIADNIRWFEWVQ